ncbi:tetratricopeptide repeat protein [Opisthorchis viverrini]|uniref:Tetratricopeptide repeat protein n=1 Tax=Opisthorchis viverrini TaxID=6198 RepID=A0A1S8X1B1_OPIVI|nr:tetratricopeptide repeat protein [Opisthorchis viverrini]
MELNDAHSQKSDCAKPPHDRIACEPLTAGSADMPIADTASVDGQKPILSNYFTTEATSEDPFESVFSQEFSPPKAYFMLCFQQTPGQYTDGLKPLTPCISLDQSTALRLRQRDAWLPSESTRKALLDVKCDSSTTCQEIRPMLSKVDPEGKDAAHFKGDPYRILLLRYLTEESTVDALRRVPSCAEQTAPTIENLKELIANGWYHAALDTTRGLLASYGYGPEQGGAPLTPLTAQIWLARLALLVRVRSYDVAECELSSFQTLDAPNVYFEHSPDLYPERAGSIIPFSLRLLHAELPFYLSRSAEALDRLYYLLAVIHRIQCNLRKGYTEDGSMTQPGADYRESSLSLWTCREVRVLSTCLSIYISDSDYSAAIETVHQLAVCCSGNKAVLRGLSSILGRIYLQLGDLETAKAYFAQAVSYPNPKRQPQLAVQQLFHEAFLYLGKNEYEEAKRLFHKILGLDPTNVVAANNVAVCSLYLGQLSEAIRVLDTLTTTGLSSQPSGQVFDFLTSLNTGTVDPESHTDSVFSSLQRRFCLHDALIFNLAVLYEVESDGATSKKVSLLQRIARLPGEPVHISSFKLPIT